MEERKEASTNGVGVTGCQSVERCPKLKSKWIKDLNIKPDTLNLIEEKVGNSLEHIGTGDNFLKRMPIVKVLRSTVNKWDL